MYAKSLVLASALAMATSVAANQPERPRIYFPREIKREYINTTITTSESSSSTGNPTTTTTTTTTTITTSESSSSTGEPTTTTTITTSESSSSTGPPTTIRSSSTTKRDLLGGLVSGIFGSDPIESNTASSTITSGSGLPKITLYPTTRDTESKQLPSTRTKNLSTDSVILIGPTGIVSSSKEPPTAKDPTSEASTARPSSVDAPPAVNNTAPATTSTTGGGILDPIGTLATLLLPGPSGTTVIQTMSTTAPVPSTGASATGGPSGATASTTTTGPPSTGTPSGLPPQLESPLPNGGSTTANSTTGPSAAKTPSGLLPTLPLPLPLPLSTGGSTTTNSRVGPTTTKTPSGFLSSSTPSLTTPSLATPSLATPSLTLLLPTGGSSTKISPVSLLPSNGTTVVPLTKTTSGSTIATGLPTSTTRVIPIADGTTTTGFVTTPTKVTDLPVTIPTTSQTRLPSTLVRVGNSTLTVSHTTTKSTSAKPTVIPTTSTSTASQSTVQTPTTKPIRPTATVSNTDNWLPTTIVIEPTKFSFTAPTTTATRTTSRALPTTIPKIIYPDDPNKPAPEGTVPIHIGFKSPLNYLFVSSNTVAAAQIFKFLPRALSDASGVDVNKLQICKLVPYNTQDTWGFVTTIAELNYPATLVDKLQTDIYSTNSVFYHNADPIVRNLTDLIEMQIRIRGNINDGSSNSSGESNGGGNGNNNSNDAFGSGNGGNQSSKQKATTAGIAIAALGFSAMYGAAMFIIARRYKRKRQGHRRASSITSSPASSEMRYNGNGSPALMGGALYSRDVSTYGAAGARDSHGSGGHSARTANISAPVATENSLGWN